MKFVRVKGNDGRYYLRSIKEHSHPTKNVENNNPVVTNKGGSNISIIDSDMSHTNIDLAIEKESISHVKPSNFNTPQNVFEPNSKEFIHQQYQNIKTNLITTTEDKLNLVLIEYESDSRKKHQWSTPLGILTSLALCLLTSKEMNNLWGIESHVWQAILIISIFLSAGWLIKAIYNAFKVKNKLCIDVIINKIKSI